MNAAETRKKILAPVGNRTQVVQQLKERRTS